MLRVGCVRCSVPFYVRASGIHAFCCLQGWGPERIPHGCQGMIEGFGGVRSSVFDCVGVGGAHYPHVVQHQLTKCTLNPT